MKKAILQLTWVFGPMINHLTLSIQKDLCKHQIYQGQLNENVRSLEWNHATICIVLNSSGIDPTTLKA